MSNTARNIELYLKKIPFNIIFILIGFSPFITLFFKQFDHAITQDWTYFNSLSWLTQSCIFNYHTLPIHDPWTVGGFDLFANPQSRFFSPLIIFDILFRAPFSNILSLAALGIVGSWGCYKLLRFFKIDKYISLACSLIYINSSWFALHFAEGHIAFGSFQLLALGLWVLLKINNPRFIYSYFILNAFFILDGGMYTFIFYNILFIALILFGNYKISTLLEALKNYKSITAGIISFCLLVSPRIIPLMSIGFERTVFKWLHTIQGNMILEILFNPFQSISKPTSIPFIGFHEIGCYIGILSTLLISWFLIINKHPKQRVSFLIIAIVFLLIGLGSFPGGNPWLLIDNLPVRIHTRILIVFYVLFIVFLAFSLSRLKTKVKPYILFIILFALSAESIFVSQHVGSELFKSDKLHDPSIFKNHIKSNNITTTIKYGIKPLIYTQNNTGCKTTYEPEYKQGDIKHSAEPDYRGEIYLTEGSGTAEVISFTPGKVLVKYKLDTTSTIRLNTSYLLGWETNGNVECFESDGLLTIKPDDLENTVVLRYRPEYLKYIFALYFAGVILTLFSFYYFKKRAMKTEVL